MKQFAEELKEKDVVQSVFVVREKTVQTGKNGRPYISMFLTDISGSIDARVWDNVEHISQLFETGDFVKVKGQVQVYQNRKQLIIHSIQRAGDEEFNIADLMKASARDPEQMYEELVGIVRQIKDDHIRELTLTILQEPDLRRRLLRCPAAKTIHHAYIGGLLEHVLSICAIMDFIAGHYPVLDKDLLIFGAIFHDLGKVWELDVGGGIHYTDEGRLIGHLVLSSELIEKTASKILGFPNETKNVLKHIVLSHHGKLEYGSPKRPKLIEAFVVSAIDDFDSKMNTLEFYLREEMKSGEKWSRYSPAFDRYFYLNWLRDSEPEEKPE